MNKMTENRINKMTTLRWSAVILVTAAIAGAGRSAPGATITGTAHDLSAKGWGTTELCKFCHTPHLAQAVAGAPLWNHQTTVASYAMYNSATFRGATSQTQPGPTSKLCLSCHDGTVAVDSFANAGTLQAGTHFISSTNRVGSGNALTGDHPIAFTYNAALVALDTHLVMPASTNYVDAAGLIPLFGSKLECASCHSSHNNTYAKFLRISNAGSALCLKCHLQ